MFVISIIISSVIIIFPHPNDHSWLLESIPAISYRVF